MTSLKLNDIPLTWQQSDAIYRSAIDTQERIVDKAGLRLYLSLTAPPPADLVAEVGPELVDYFWPYHDPAQDLAEIEALATAWSDLSVVAAASYIGLDLTLQQKAPEDRKTFDLLVREAAGRCASKHADEGAPLSPEQRKLLHEHWDHTL